MSACVWGQQCIHIRVAPPHGTEVEMMGVDRLLLSMTEGEDRAGEQIEAFSFIILTEWLIQHICILGLAVPMKCRYP